MSKDENFELIDSFSIDTKKILEQVTKAAEQLSESIKAAQSSIADGEKLEILFIYDFGREIKIEQLEKDTGKSEKEIRLDKNFEKEIDQFASFFSSFVLEELKQKKYKGISFSTLLVEDTEEADTYAGVKVKPGTRLDKIVKKALASTKTAIEIPQVIAKYSEKYQHALDKVNTSIWKQLEAEAKQIPGQNFLLQAGKEVISVNLQSEQAQIAFRALTPFDRRVYFAVSNVYISGYHCMSASTIYNQMGGKGNCSPTQKKKILDSVRKLMGTVITIDNSKYYDSEADKYGYPTVDDSVTQNLLYAMFATRKINGVLTQDAIEVFTVPILYKFAKDRKQITTFDLELLQGPLSFTNSNILLYDYLVEQIAHIKHGSISNIMTFETIYKNCSITTKMQRSRARKYITDLLDYFITCKNGIKGYEIKDKSIEIRY